MDQLNKLLNGAKETCIPATDLALSKRLGVVPSAVSNWRNGRARPDVVACEKIANITGNKPLSVIAMINEEREISRDAKAVWRRLASAAVVVLMLDLGTPAEAKNIVSEGLRFTTDYALCEVEGGSGNLRESARPSGLGALPCVHRVSPLSRCPTWYRNGRLAACELRASASTRGR